jgi:hypothetical protein
MDSSIAIVIAAFIAAFISIGGIILTQWFNYLHRKEDAKERFFYEIYQRRLALYEEIIKTLAEMGRPEDKILTMTPRKFSDKALVDYQTLMSFIDRLRIFGSPEAAKIISEAKARLEVLLQNDLKSAGGRSRGIPVIDAVAAAAAAIAFDGDAVRKYFILISRTLAEFAESAGKEAMADFVDQKISKILKGFAFKKDKKTKKKLPQKEAARKKDRYDDGPSNINSNSQEEQAD